MIPKFPVEQNRHRGFKEILTGSMRDDEFRHENKKYCRKLENIYEVANP